MSLQKQIKELEEMLNRLQSEKRKFRFVHSARLDDVKTMDDSIIELKKEHADLLIRQEKINTCIKKHPLVRQVKKQSQEIMKQSSLSLMQARNHVASTHGYQNWDDLIEQLSQELNDYLDNDNLSLDKTIPQENQIAINLGKNQYGMDCFLKPEHWNVHVGLINCSSILEKFNLFESKAKILMMDHNYPQNFANAMVLSSKDDWNIWQNKEKGLAYLNNENQKISDMIRHYLQNRIKKNHYAHELWIVNASEYLNKIEPSVIAQIRSFNIHLVFNYATLSSFSSNEMIANNIQTQIFDAKTHHPELLSDIFSCDRSCYQMPSDKSKMAMIYQNRLIEIA